MCAKSAKILGDDNQLFLFLPKAKSNQGRGDWPREPPRQSRLFSKNRIGHIRSGTPETQRPARSRLCLAAFRAVEENPDRKIIAEIFKAMFHSGGDKQEIMRGKLPAFARTNEVTGATNDYVDFITLMRTLRIVAPRRVSFTVRVPWWKSAMERSRCESDKRASASLAPIAREDNELLMR